jgi:hypothetical protein
MAATETAESGIALQLSETTVLLARLAGQGNIVVFLRQVALRN